LAEESLASELQELDKEYNELVNKNEAVQNKIARKKSIQILVGYFGLFLLLILFALVVGTILTLLLGIFSQYSDLFFITGAIFLIAWGTYFLASRIVVKNISANSILQDEISGKLEEIKIKINKLKALIEKEKQKTQKPVPEIQTSPSELEQTEKGNFKFVNSSGEIKWGTEKQLIQWKDEEQKKKGLVKFIPFSLQMAELMREEGHAKTFKSKVSKGLKKSDVPSQVTWGTPEQVFEWKQKEKGYIKFVDANGKNKWGTPKQVAEWKKEKNANK